MTRRISLVYDASCRSILDQFLRWSILPLAVEVDRSDLRPAPLHVVLFDHGAGKDRVVVSKCSVGSITAKLYPKGKNVLSRRNIKMTGISLVSIFYVVYVVLCTEILTHTAFNSIVTLCSV